LYGGEIKESVFHAAAAAISGATAAIAGTFGPIGTSDAPDAFFLCFANIKDYAAQYGANDRKDQKINRFHRQFIYS
jgi:hypothetical protein